MVDEWQEHNTGKIGNQFTHVHEMQGFFFFKHIQDFNVDAK